MKRNAFPIWENEQSNRIEPGFVAIRRVHGIGDMKYRSHSVVAINRETGNMISGCARSFGSGWRMIPGTADRVGCETCLQRERKRNRVERESENRNAESWNRTRSDRFGL